MVLFLYFTGITKATFLSGISVFVAAQEMETKRLLQSS